MEIRAEKSDDTEAVYQVNVAAFGRKSEADLVDALRGAASALSFVAVESGQIVGHVFFSPVEIVGVCADDVLVFGLAPVSVIPNYQRQGIGSLLIQYGLKECAQLGGSAVVVLGFPEYYSRFGFTPAREKGLECEYPVPDEVFMVLELESGALEGCVGMVRYCSEFNKLE
ncbi:GNAT family N-acetyltransferase [Pleurocapsa sp. CCALA 161]|uniref:GNAT family N-acetyltransferase n=1 Tax=Pleurocapsa sp. CCALA 161 TaxID=2107688 RepID=UPI000D07BFD4|nr:N-acetyltransferase [Pleurocapsa sp. CCALA 161]PSB08578.1 GNAT family N-acetyltransferase [Pleurocapsa sp. CCALA 161]